jgi:hypothetical protein
MLINATYHWGMASTPNTKQELAGGAVAGGISWIAGALVTKGKVKEAILAGLVGVAVHYMIDRPITQYIASHPQEFPRFLAQ